RLVSPQPADPAKLIRASQALPDEFPFGVGWLVVHGFARDGIDVEVIPSHLVFGIEVDVYEPLPPEITP
ncbi:MAG: hypothetical protein ACYDCB_00535, partial [Candidatus Dormibacteria bacterium]